MSEQQRGREGSPGEPGKPGQFGLGGTGGTGGRGGDPSGEGGQGGQGGDVYVDTRAVRHWVRKVWVAYVALAVSMGFALYIGSHEHFARINDNKNAILFVKRSNAHHEEADKRDAKDAIEADCQRINAIRHLLLDQNVIVTENGKRELDVIVSNGSRKGCVVK